LLHLAARAYAEGGNTIVASQYGFMGHRIAALAAGAKLVLVPERDYCVDFAAMSAAVNEQTTVVYVANPANPTGTVASGNVIRDFHAGLPASVLLVIDAAYAEFAGQMASYESGLALVRGAARNVLVTRTFSKMYGLAGLRIGWGYSAPNIIDAIERVRPAFNANSVAQAAALAALEDDGFVERSREVNRQGLLQLREALGKLNIYTTNSVCNFVLARFPRGRPQAAAAFLALKQRGVIVRPVDGYGLADCLRISVGTFEDNAAVIEGLQEFVRGR
jgi:histidinol-phosphate aminotransferase